MMRAWDLKKSLCSGNLPEEKARRVGKGRMNEQAAKQRVQHLQEKLGYRFRDMTLLHQAFQHASFVNEQTEGSMEDNERLEFLGDAVLDLAISHLLMGRFPHADEGTLSRFRSMLVDEHGLFTIASSLNLGDHVLLGKGEEQTEGRKKPSILANTVEALLGAVYLDGGYDAAFQLVGRVFALPLKRIDSPKMVHDFKSRLQEVTQKMDKMMPRYRLVEEKGPPHDRRFVVEIVYQEKTLAQGEGRSKKEAEQHAAREALLCLETGENRS
jgi:ribonuclease-3